MFRPDIKSSSIRSNIYKRGNLATKYTSIFVSIWDLRYIETKYKMKMYLWALTDYKKILQWVVILNYN